MKHITILLFCISISVAQENKQVYEIPFSSKGNIIELSVANSSTLTAEGIKVEVTNPPEGIKFVEKTVTLTALKSKEEQTASFTFAVEKTAQVNKEQTLNFTIADKTGQTWTKEIRISIAPPTTFELYQNYPNPFNPTTTIGYQLPGVGTQPSTQMAGKFIVSLKIYDIIGREVINLVNEQQETGYHQINFNAQRFASGIYFYQLTATDNQNKQQIFRKKMILLR